MAAGRFEYTRHAAERTIQRGIGDREIIEAGASLLTVETYPDDKYGPSMLLLGFAQNGRPLHIQVSLADTPLVRIVTIYEPDPAEWDDYRSRR